MISDFIFEEIQELLISPAPLNLQYLMELLFKSRCRPDQVFDRILLEVKGSCKQAYHFYQFILNSNWEPLLKWIREEKDMNSKRNIMKTISSMLSWAMNDCFQQAMEKEEMSMPASSRPPLSNITNTIHNGNTPRSSQ